jgi:hypothetical protein
MRNKYLILSVFLLIVALFPFAATTHAQSIKQRMAARLPTIDAMKNSGIVGENNRGFLQYLTSKRPHQNIVAAENHDRQTVYAEIGKKEGAPAALVGQRRARMLLERGPHGQWFQKPNGKWFKK